MSVMIVKETAFCSNIFSLLSCFFPTSTYNSPLLQYVFSKCLYPVSENCQLISDAGVAKAGKSAPDLFVLGLLSGAFLALAGAASTMAAYNLLAYPETFGFGRLVAAAIFPCGLILVAIAGAELFTGNTLMLLPLVQRRIKVFSMLRNWVIVYTANLVGAMTMALLLVFSGQLDIPPNDLLGGMTITIAAVKCNFAFHEAFLLGIFCNWLVCLAVWMSISAKDLAGKVLVIFFPICAFVTAGFEHSIANMFFIPAGLFAAQFNPHFLEAAVASPEVLASLTWQNFFLKNLLPVTLGNIIGGGVCVALTYGYVHRNSHDPTRT